MFQVANLRFQIEQQKQDQAVPKSQSSVSQVHQHTSTVVITQGMTTMDPPPSIIHIDQNLLDELLKRFPEVPNDVVIKLIQQNHNHREQCMMALARETPRYPPQPPINLSHSSGSLIIQHGPMDAQGITNGLRNRSDSAGSRSSVSSVTGQRQSPNSHQQHYPHSMQTGPGGQVMYHHSSSEPHMANMNDSGYVNAGPSTAPVQPEFRPFPNVHRPSVEYTEGIPGASGPSYNQYEYAWGGHGGITGPPSSSYGHSSVQEPWRSAQGSAMHPSSTGQYGQHTRYGQQQQAPSTPSRPGQFDQNFPPSTWDTFSPGSPSRRPPSQGSTPTHVPTTQSPVSTPPRHPHPWEPHNPTSPSMYRTPSPSGHGYTPPRQDQSAIHTPPRPDQSGSGPSRTDSSGSTYVSSIYKNIGGNSDTSRNTGGASINIELGLTAHDNRSFNMSQVGKNLPPHNPNHPPPIPKRPPNTFHHASARSMSVSESRTILKNPPPKVLSHPSSLSTIPQSPMLPITDFHRTPSSEGQQIPSGSLAGGEDTAYTQSLLVHQKARLDKLQQDIRSLFDHREYLKQQVANKEKCVLQAQRNKLGNRPGISSHDLQKVREENRTLQVDSHLLTLEFDRITKGQAVIGRDPNEDFYASIQAGQEMNSTSSSSSGSTTNTSSTSSGHHVSTHPPAPPLAHREPSRDLDNVHEPLEEPWSCSACTFDNHPEITQCEICNMPRVGRR